MEKEVLGIYVSGHPLDDDMEMLERNTNASTADFVIDVETGKTVIHDQQSCIIGGIISDINVKLTRKNQNMAFLTLEDLRGTVEVIVFPRQYASCQSILKEDAKVFIKGIASVSEEESKLICNQIVPFQEVAKELWIQFPDKNTYFREEQWLKEELKVYPGKSPVIVYCKAEKAVNRLGRDWMVETDQDMIYQLENRYGKENIRLRSLGL